jgi:chromosome partitioning protein
VDIAIMADKGGVGKSTLAVHLAERLRQLGHDAGLLDLDRNATSSWWLRKGGRENGRPGVPVYPLTAMGGALPNHAVRLWDTPAHPAVEMQQALVDLCDALLIVAQADEASQVAAAQLYHRLAARGAATVRVVFNAMQPNSREGADSIAAARAAGMACCDTVVRRYSCYSHAQWDGRAVCDYPYASADKAWSDVAALAGELLALPSETAHAR